MDCTLVGARSMPKGPKGQSASLMASNAMPPGGDCWVMRRHMRST